MAKVAFELVSPERLLLSLDADQVTAPGTEGDFGVLPGHAPLIASLRSGVVEIEAADAGEVERIYIGGGLAEVSTGRMTILAEEAIAVAELDRATLEQKIQDTREDIEDATDDETRRIADGRLARLEDLLAAL